MVILCHKWKLYSKSGGSGRMGVCVGHDLVLGMTWCPLSCRKLKHTSVLVWEYRMLIVLYWMVFTLGYGEMVRWYRWDFVGLSTIILFYGDFHDLYFYNNYQQMWAVFYWYYHCLDYSGYGIPPVISLKFEMSHCTFTCMLFIFSSSPFPPSLPPADNIDCEGEGIVEQAEFCHYSPLFRDMCGPPAIVLLEGVNISAPPTRADGSDGLGDEGICTCQFSNGQRTCIVGNHPLEWWM